MDTLEPEQKKVLLALGNRAVNSIYLAHIPTVKVIPPRPIATSARYFAFLKGSISRSAHVNL